MVPLGDGPNVGGIRAALAAASAIVDEAPLPQAFRAWVLDDPAPLADVAVAAAEGFGIPTERSFRQVATLGYAAAARRLPEAIRPVLADGIRWIGARQWHRPLREPTLEVDGVAMLGVALGARSLEGAAHGALGTLAVTSAGMPSLSPFNRSLMVAAAHVLEALGRPDLSGMLPEIRVALTDLGCMDGDAGCGPEAWRNAIQLAPGDGGPARAALTLCAFDALCARNMPARLGRLEPSDVVRVLSGVARSLRGWTWDEKPLTRRSNAVRWEVQNEYHVQNLLWVVLAPLFPDLRAEEYTEPVGPKNPRMDLTIPSLRLVVEVKFVRPGKRFADIVEEVAADASLYGADPRWDVLVPFVWDDSRRTEEHATLIDGLRRLPIVHDAVVVPRPGKMDRPSPPSRRARTAD